MLFYLCVIFVKMLVVTVKGRNTVQPGQETVDS